MGLDWAYEAIDVAPDALDEFMGSLDASWRGLSVTMPHKEAMLRFGRPDEVVQLTGVANTFIREPGGQHHVHNTDVQGFVTACRDHGTQRIERATIIGNGATARSALVAAALLGATRVTVVARAPERAQPLLGIAENIRVDADVVSLGEEPEHSDLLISTIPSAGVEPHADQLVDTTWLAFDAIYHPWPTPIGAAAARIGAPVLSGLHLLAGQAVDQVRLMTGHEVGFADLYDAGLQEMARRDLAQQAASIIEG